MNQTTTVNAPKAPDMGLFWGCVIALVATGFGFIARVLTANQWGPEFGLTETQVGEIFGVGFWPLAISLVLFSLIIDKVGYKVAMWFGLICHTLSTILIVTASGYQGMYIGTFVLALGSGCVEAYINPVVATMFDKDKSKWLNILHAGWPGGMVFAGLIILILASGMAWRIQIGLILIPTLIYAVMLFNKRFPVNERVAAGVSYKEMLEEVGAIGALIIFAMVIRELGRLFSIPDIAQLVLALAAAGAFWFYTRSLGRPLYIFLLLLMTILATTELGVDSWITSLMESEMSAIGLQAGWVLIYTSAIMMFLRLFASGPLVKKLTPLGLLAVCALLAALGLIFLSKAAGFAILLAATLYGVGKTFFWPTTLGIVAEQFPKGGALTLNAIAGVGMLAVGIVGNPFLGNFQDKQVDKQLMAYDQSNNTSYHSSYVTEPKRSVFGKYLGLDVEKVENAPEEDKQVITTVQNTAKKSALSTVAIFPIIMFVCYILLIFYFRGKGGYKQVELGGDGGH
ncbi:MAG: MFS transporter [Saprospiraceae bacterium]|nr:MFS transporter [Saprospiraceae bacterium]